MRFVPSRLSFFLLLILCLAGVGTASATDDRAEFITETYRMGLDLLTPELLLLEEKNITEEEVLRLSACIAETSNSLSVVDADIRERLENFLRPRVWMQLAKEKLRPSDGDLMRMFIPEKEKYRRRNWIDGARILVEKGPDAEAQVARIKEALAQPEADFNAIATEYYRSLGMENDGNIGQRHWGEIREDLFNLYWETPEEKPLFGPVETPTGYLFGMLKGKGDSYFLPLNVYRADKEPAMLSESIGKLRTEVRTAREKELDFERLYAGDMAEVPAPTDPAFRAGGRVYTFADTRAMNPGVFGDEASPEFHRVIAERAAQTLLTESTWEGRPLEDAPLYRTLYQALYAHAVRYHEMRVGAKELDFSEETLKAWYLENGELFRPLDEVRVAVFMVPMNPKGHVMPEPAYRSKREAWATINELAEKLRADEGDGSVFAEDVASSVTLRVSPKEWVSVTEIPPPAARPINEATENTTSDIIFGFDSYAVFRIYDRRRLPVPDYEAISEEVRGRYEMEMRNQLLLRNHPCPSDESCCDPTT